MSINVPELGLALFLEVVFSVKRDKLKDNSITREFKLNFTFLLNGKHPGFSSITGAFKSKSGVGHSSEPKIFSSRTQSVSSISFCQGIDTEPVLNFE